MANSPEALSLYAVLALLLRWGVSLHSYSGKGKPPMFGDYEAQRHWMEITYHLPVKEWYQNSTNNDLLYWGLDYPPLSAYHSLICGVFAQWVNPEFIALFKSRGYESYSHKFFMRVSVILADILVFIPAVFWWCSEARRRANPSKTRSGFPLVLLVLAYPGLILIDHGHFQYNSVSIGFMIAAIAAIMGNCNIIGAILFTLAVNYKQMELYHALPFFFYLLGTCLQQKSYTRKFYELAKIGSAVLLTFSIIWLPLAVNDAAKHTLIRLFPFNRGPYEDKVANFWCSASVLYKFHRAWGNVGMARACLAATAIAVLPSCVDLVMRPEVKRLHLALVNSSLAFFLFSYHVHEKSILLVALPVALIASQDWWMQPALVLPHLWFLCITTLSMFPLLTRDGLTIPAVCLTILYPLLCLLVASGFESPPKNSPFRVLMQSNILVRYAAVMSLTIFVILIWAYLTIKPPEIYPDLFPLLISAFSCAHFIPFFVYFNWIQFTLPSEKV
ncbi:dolichyl pyrophosphate Man9GlcNAc2 alpha-1,3-glucosyltransferase [Ischnura elegans]|uniref:dolichyl pyrophosphate Man9GlcNAc2 alpha-1,3-glucosyltransferase n=1 Tax=Ischnura elegans TaxID=197161 RepID=UPI001ED87B7E|nr:dolichyl pyrophosphate Man9GlcNAc2 alpha-1,3-glucosyltransferase [Ischnura elegans]XP_046386597.1 dolichyl pyrophosphate Man9GlcNAc2 alpha-1,3-glucosyltransferase [Ischnura elegans]